MSEVRQRSVRTCAADPRDDRYRARHVVRVASNIASMLKAARSRRSWCCTAPWRFPAAPGSSKPAIPRGLISLSGAAGRTARTFACAERGDRARRRVRRLGARARAQASRSVAAAGTKGAIPSLRRFAKRLSTDYDAVRAAVTLDWSNGPVEGQINRLKTIKRQMYGRVGLDLLERRFLPAV